MPFFSKGNLKIDYTDEGQGQPVILIHSSVSYQSTVAFAQRVTEISLPGHSNQPLRLWRNDVLAGGGFTAVPVRTGPADSDIVRGTEQSRPPRRALVRRFGRAQGRHDARPSCRESDFP